MKYDANLNARNGYIKGYRQALKEIKNYVEKIKNKKANAFAPTEVHKCYQGGRILGYDDVINYIDQQST
jgi:hypothetical protein